MKVHCLKLKNKDLNKDIALFLISVIKKHISYFAYNETNVLPNVQTRIS